MFTACIILWVSFKLTKKMIAYVHRQQLKHELNRAKLGLKDPEDDESTIE